MNDTLYCFVPCGPAKQKTSLTSPQLFSIMQLLASTMVRDLNDFSRTLCADFFSILFLDPYCIVHNLVLCVHVGRWIWPFASPDFS